MAMNSDKSVRPEVELANGELSDDALDDVAGGVAASNSLMNMMNPSSGTGL